MTHRLSTACVVLALCGPFAWSAPARANTIRLALIVGNNTGGGDLRPLRFAERDASKMAQVLGELGRVAPGDLFLLQGRRKPDLDAAFNQLQKRIAAIHSDRGTLALLLFYYSGHSDGEALELDSDRLPYGELRKRLIQSGADTRVIIVDSCRSGSLLAAKGAARVPAFDITLADDLPATGQVLLTSSAADEQALESSEIQGSFFTHHLVSGLRGAADATGDGRVTLAEAYRYAYAHTVAATADQLAVTQHPGYDFQISGTGELVLTELSLARSQINLPAGFDRALVIATRRGEVLAEVAPGGPRRVVVPPGEYLVRLWRDAKAFSTRLSVAAGAPTSVAWSSVARETEAVPGQAKGEPPDEALSELTQAISAFDGLDFDKAASLIHELLARDPPSQMAAKGHVYLSLIALNSYRPDEARAELRLALLDDPSVELPYGSSPKAVLAFAEVKDGLQRELRAGRTTSLAPPAPKALSSESLAPVEPLTAHATASRRSHVVSLVLIGVAVAAVAASVYGGVQVENYNTILGSAAGSKPQSAYDSARSNAQPWVNLWWPLAIGGALAGGGAVLTW